MAYSKKFSLKKYLLAFFIIAIIIFVLEWLFPDSVYSKLDKSVDETVFGWFK